MRNWKELLVSPSTSIIETMKNIDQNAAQIALVVDDDFRLLGTVTDGDIRRGILRGISLDDQVSKVMNKNPITMKKGASKQAIKRVFQEKKLRQLPILNKNNQVVDVIFSDVLFDSASFDNWVVLMAGGLGTRLRPLTEHIPKPMLTVGTKPILQTILESFIEHGFHQFYFSVNYKREIIKEYFGDGLGWGINIQYLDEDRRLGTAGALSLFTEKPTKPIIVMNGDILTKVNFQQLLQFHEENGSVATMCVREYQHQVPYGVVRTEGTMLCSIEEKPIERYFVNAGIYVLNPEVLELIPENKYFDMPSLFESIIKLQKKTNVFPIREYWLDIGQIPDFEKANLEFLEVFG
ncbi:nucleotidyl transferase family protein [Anoxybacillus sp. B7M1]|uniref:nucleotidyltransferase family protein n=1 Tax=unclassified Anoxybacillus TaxID=2639704 RepID=UPI0005CD3117|nr:MULTISPECIES: nucleotidyltransferase family protein [unclassified Anoxybacillus]ANB56053.1 nucleotidyl transferase family protein [Anoxybacillus sp. B2M1]ANB63767.1 nucleotidyl transferase family protein [Anoxybacillus sp. B7M1]